MPSVRTITDWLGLTAPTGEQRGRYSGGQVPAQPLVCERCGAVIGPDFSAVHAAWHRNLGR